MRSTLATVVWVRAATNIADAIAKQTAKPRPEHPIVRKTRHGLPCSITAVKASRARKANTARPATCVTVLTEIPRWTRPALDQASAASAM
jgi:hypothetical protein